MSTPDENAQPIPVPRGIPNVSGVACHLTSALHLLLHAIPPLRAALLEIASYNDNNSDTTLVQKLANLTSSLFQNNDVVVNPLPLYQALEQSTSVDPHELGDAAKAVRVLLHTLQQDDDSLLQPILQHYVMGATLEQTLVGECVFYNQTFRRIQTKQRLVPCPFSIPVILTQESTTSVQEALSNATIVPQDILGVDWNQISNYTQQPEEDGDLRSSECEWATTKTTCLASLPHYLLIHLQRAHYQDDAVQLSTHELRVDFQLNMEPFVTNEFLQQEQPCCLTYQLVGAILHVSEDTTDEEEEQENGHYVTLVQSHDGQEWYLLNDDNVTVISNEHQVLEMISGCPNSDNLDGSLYCTTVLAYGQTCHCSKATNQTLMDDLRDSLQQRQQQQSLETNGTATTLETPVVDWNQPLQLVGRRLRIKWKSGKYYSGIISSYNDESGKHCITYKDGDVRHYTLRKKTIEWIS